MNSRNFKVYCWRTIQTIKRKFRGNNIIYGKKPISIELPNNIECIIETTDVAIKNQTASSSYKPAILDCGIKINVPPFIESGEKIIIDTRTLEYVKRIN